MAKYAYAPLSKVSLRRNESINPIFLIFVSLKMKEDVLFLTTFFFLPFLIHRKPNLQCSPLACNNNQSHQRRKIEKGAFVITNTPSTMIKMTE